MPLMIKENFVYFRFLSFCQNYIFQMCSPFCKSYIDWMAKVSDGGWSVLSIAVHKDHDMPVVLGPLEAMRGELRATCEGKFVDGRDFFHPGSHQQVFHLICLFDIIVPAFGVCFVN